MVEKESNNKKGGREEQVRKREKREREREELRAVLNRKEETDQTGSEMGEKMTLVGSKGIIRW